MLVGQIAHNGHAFMQAWN